MRRARTSWVPGGACGSGGRPTRTCVTGARPAGSPRRCSPPCSKTAFPTARGEQVPVDAVVCAGIDQVNALAVRPVLARTVAEAAACRGSKYNTVAMNEVLRHISHDAGALRPRRPALPPARPATRPGALGDVARARRPCARDLLRLDVGAARHGGRRAARRARPGRPRDGGVPRSGMARRDAARDARRRGTTASVPRLLRPAHGGVHAAALPPVSPTPLPSARTSPSATPGSTGSPTTRPSPTASPTSSRARPPESGWSAN